MASTQQQQTAGDTTSVSVLISQQHSTKESWFGTNRVI